jgi:hypothetical protein
VTGLSGAARVDPVVTLSTFGVAAAENGLVNGLEAKRPLSLQAADAPASSPTATTFRIFLPEQDTTRERILDTPTRNSTPALSNR